MGEGDPADVADGAGVVVAGAPDLAQRQLAEAASRPEQTRTATSRLETAETDKIRTVAIFV